MMKEHNHLLRLLTRYIVGDDLEKLHDPPQRRSSNVTQMSNVSDDSQLFRTPSRRSPLVASSLNSSPFSTPSSNSPFCHSPLSATKSTSSSSSECSENQRATQSIITSYELFRRLDLPKSTKSELLAFNEKITTTSSCFQSVMRDDFIRAIRLHNPLREGQTHALFSLLRNIFLLSFDEKINNDENDRNVPNKIPVNDAEMFYIQWIQCTEVYEIIICETANWPSEYLPIIRPNNLHKSDVAGITAAWNKKNHREKVHAIIQKWLKSSRIVCKRRCSNKKKNVTDNSSASSEARDHEENLQHYSTSDTSVANDNASSPTLKYSSSQSQDEEELEQQLAVLHKKSLSLTPDDDRHPPLE